MGVDVRFFPILIEAMAAVMELGRRLDVQHLLPHCRMAVDVVCDNSKFLESGHVRDLFFFLRRMR
jgi:hypothetical protein